MNRPFRCQRIDYPFGRSLRTPSQKHLTSSATGGGLPVLLPAPAARRSKVPFSHPKKRVLSSNLFFTEMEDLNRPIRCQRIVLPAGRSLRTPSQKRLTSSATGGVSVLLPAPRGARVTTSFCRKKRELFRVLFLRRCAAAQNTTLLSAKKEVCLDLFFGGEEGFEQALPVSANRPPFRSVSSDTVTKAPRFFRHWRRFGAFARAVRGARVTLFFRKKRGLFTTFLF